MTEGATSKLAKTYVICRAISKVGIVINKKRKEHLKKYESNKNIQTSEFDSEKDEGA